MGSNAVTEKHNAFFHRPQFVCVHAVGEFASSVLNADNKLRSASWCGFGFTAGGDAF